MLWSIKLRAVRRLIYARGQRVINFFGRMNPTNFKDKKKRPASGALDNPVEDISRVVKSGSAKIYGPSVANGHGKLVPAFSSEKINRGKASTPLNACLSTSGTLACDCNHSIEKPYMKNHSERKMPVNKDWEYPTVSTAYLPFIVNSASNETKIQLNTIPPLRPPHPPPGRNKDNGFPSCRPSVQYSQGPNSVPTAVRSSVVSPLGRNHVNEHANGLSNEELNMNSVAASVARKEALERERERATKEARERAAAERAAVEKAFAEAQERAEKAAVQRAQAGACKRAVTEAKERVATEARKGPNSEARVEGEGLCRAENSAVQKVIEEARERAAKEAHYRAAAAASVKQQNMGARARSAPRPRANSKDPVIDTQSQNRQGPEVARTSSGTASAMRKVSRTINIDEDYTSIFGAAPSSREFQEIERESEGRQSSRWKRQKSIQEHVAKAMAEMDQRKLQTQNEQAEINRIAKKLDVEIRRWAAGKGGDIRALLSTLQHAVSLTDLRSLDSVKKIYRKATLCVHPDKVQQRGANLQQKYIAEKVFDLLKEAWEKIVSKEHF